MSEDNLNYEQCEATLAVAKRRCLNSVNATAVIGGKRVRVCQSHRARYQREGYKIVPDVAQKGYHKPPGVKLWDGQTEDLQ